MPESKKPFPPVSPEFLRRYFYENAERRVATELYDFLFWRRGKFLRPNEKEKIIEKYLEEELESFFVDKKINIPRLQFFINSPCTLRCRECNALIPDIYKSSTDIKKYFLSEEEFKLDLEALSTVASSIRHFILLGGEPLLHKNIHKLISLALNSNLISTIEIVTNGTVLPKGDVLKGLLSFRDRIFFRVSDYSSNTDLSAKLKYEELERLFKDHGFKHQKTFMPWFRLLPGEPAQSDARSREIFRNCYIGRCIQVFDGKLAVCPKASSMDALGQTSHTEQEIIDLRTEPNLRQAIINFYEKDFFEACRSCGGYGEEVLPGEQIDSH